MGVLKKFAMIVSCVFLLPMASPATDDFSESPWAMPPAASIEDQFNNMPTKNVEGYPFTFSYWNNQVSPCSLMPFGWGCFIGDDPDWYRHYQGMNRVQAPDGTAYLYLARSGNVSKDVRDSPACWFGCGPDYPGEILVVQMGDRNRTGEALEENPTGTDNGLLQPRENDFTVRSIHLDGLVDGGFQWLSESGDDITHRISWKHSAGGQQVDNLLFIPLSRTCDYQPDRGHCLLSEEVRGAILVFKLADENDSDITPANPGVLCQIDYFNDLVSHSGYQQLPGIGNLAVTRTDEGGYLFAHTRGGGYRYDEAMTFYEVSEADLCSNAVPSADIDLPFINRAYVWNSENLQNMDGKTIGHRFWRLFDHIGVKCYLDWQAIDFVHGTDGNLYLIGTDTCVEASVPNNHVAGLYQIETLPDKYVVKVVSWFEYILDKPIDLGSFDAVGGVYVTPTNRLVIYSADHDNEGPVSILPPDLYCPGDQRCKGLEMGEFASRYHHPPEVIPQADEEVFTYKTTLFVLGSFTDDHADDQTWEVKIDWGDGNAEQVTRFIPGELGPVEHRYPIPGEYTVTMRITDDEGFSGTGSFDVIATEYTNGDDDELPPADVDKNKHNNNNGNRLSCTVSPNQNHKRLDPTLLIITTTALIYLGRRRRSACH